MLFSFSFLVMVLMDSEAQKSTPNPAAMLATLISRRGKLQEELQNIERQVFDMETSYLQDPSQCENVLKGFGGFLSSSKSTALFKRSRKFQPKDRLFSLSSVTSPAVHGRSDFCPGRSKGGELAESRRREGLHLEMQRETEHPVKQDFDYDDDPELTF